MKQPLKLGTSINYSDTQPFEMGSHEMSTHLAQLAVEVFRVVKVQYTEVGAWS